MGEKKDNEELREEGRGLEVDVGGGGGWEKMGDWNRNEVRIAKSEREQGGGKLDFRQIHFVT